jgi:arylsulfatase A-like enzyme
MGLRKSTTVILVADHGGKGTGHGGDTIEEIQIPWVISGPGVKTNYEIKDPALMTYDTAATMARILHVKPSPCWRGRSIDEAFVRTK